MSKNIQKQKDTDMRIMILFLCSSAEVFNINGTESDFILGYIVLISKVVYFQNIAHL